MNAAARRRSTEMLPRRHRGQGSLSRQLAIDLAEEIDSLEPPVAEQLRVERDRDEGGLGGRGGRAGRGAAAATSSGFAFGGRDAIQQGHEMPRVISGSLPRPRGVVRLLVAQVRTGGAHSPVLEAAGPADLVEF